MRQNLPRACIPHSSWSFDRKINGGDVNAAGRGALSISHDLSTDIYEGANFNQIVQGSQLTLARAISPNAKGILRASRNSSIL